MLVPAQRLLALYGGRGLPYSVETGIAYWTDDGEPVRTFDNWVEARTAGGRRSARMTATRIVHHLMRRGTKLNCSFGPFTRLVVIDLDLDAVISHLVRVTRCAGAVLWAEEMLRRRMRLVVAWVRSLGGEPVVLTSPHGGYHVIFLLERAVPKKEIHAAIWEPLHAWLADAGDCLGGVGIEIFPFKEKRLRVPLGIGQDWIDPDTGEVFKAARGRRPEHVSAFLDALDRGVVSNEELEHFSVSRTFMEEDVSCAGRRGPPDGRSGRATGRYESRGRGTRPSLPAPTRKEPSQLSMHPVHESSASTELFDVALEAARAGYRLGGELGALAAAKSVLESLPGSARARRNALASVRRYVGGWQRRLEVVERRPGEDEARYMYRLIAANGEVSTKELESLFPARTRARGQGRGCVYAALRDELVGRGWIVASRPYRNGRQRRLYAAAPLRGLSRCRTLRGELTTAATVEDPTCKGGGGTETTTQESRRREVKTRSWSGIGWSRARRVSSRSSSWAPRAGPILAADVPDG